MIFIRNTSEIETWSESSQANFLDNSDSFLRVASLKKCKKVRPGRYRITKGMSNRAIINMLRSGAQEAINLRIDDVHDLSQLSAKLGKNLMCDSLQFMQAFSNDSISESFGFNSYTLPCLIIPNTYDFFWTMTPADFFTRMKKVYDNYWTEEKKQIASSIGLTPNDVGTLASIVKAETAKTEEAPKIAGLYLNRLRIGMALQSDPTAVFGNKIHSQRVYLSDLKNDSPYNTYLHAGLPPGPIDFSETIYLDAVLHSDKHGYLYMCAQPMKTGYHNFSKTLDQHNQYRREYTKWLEKIGVR